MSIGGRRAEPVLLGLYDPDQREDAETVRGRFERASQAFGPVSTYRDGALQLAVTGPPSSQVPRSGPLTVLEGYLDTPADAPPRPGAERVRAAWGRLGADGVAELRGAFALVVFDPDTGRGVLARDQLGQRPLFLLARGRQLYFASEVRLLLGALATRPAVDAHAATLWIAPSNLRENVVPYEGIERLPSGHLIEFHDGTWSRRAYWRPRYAAPLPGSAEEIALGVRERLMRSTERSLAGARRAGIFLSGGLDSSSVAGIAAHGLGADQSLHAYAATFPDYPTMDETPHILSVARHLGIGVTAIEVQGGSVFAGALEFLATWELPEASSNGFFQRPMARRAAEDGVDVVLSGEGGDELFGLAELLVADELAHGRVRKAWELVWQYPGMGRVGWRSLAAKMFVEYGVQPLLPYRLQRPLALRAERKELPEFLTPAAVKTLLAASDTRGWRHLEGPRWWRGKADIFARRHTSIGATDQMVRAARMGGIAERHPLLGDVDLVEHVLRLPPVLAFDAQYSRPDLRRAVKGLIPEDVRLRTDKITFDAIRGMSLLEDMPVIQALLEDPRARIREYVRPAAVKSLLAERPQRWGYLAPWSGNVWRLLVMEVFLRHQEDPQSTADLLGSGRLTEPRMRFVEHESR